MPREGATEAQGSPCTERGHGLDDFTQILGILSSDTRSNVAKTHLWSNRSNFSFPIFNTLLPKPKVI